MTSLVDKLVPDDLWAIVEPLLPPPPRPPYGGRRRTIPDRNCFATLVFMCRTSTPWALLPTGELGCGIATTASRRLEEWQHAGVFDRLSLVLLDQLGGAGRIDLGRVSVDSAVPTYRIRRTGAVTAADLGRLAVRGTKHPVAA